MREETSQDWIERGKQFLIEKKYQDALRCYEEAIQIDPENSFAWFHKGFIYDTLFKLEDAIHCYDEAIRLNPTSREFRNSREWINLKVGIRNTTNLSPLAQSIVDMTFEPNIPMKPRLTKIIRTKKGGLPSEAFETIIIPEHERKVPLVFSHNDYADLYIQTSESFKDRQKFKPVTDIKCKLVISQFHTKEWKFEIWIGEEKYTTVAKPSSSMMYSSENGEVSYITITFVRSIISTFYITPNYTKVSIFIYIPFLGKKVHIYEAYDQGIIWLEKIGAELFFGRRMEIETFPDYVSEGVTFKEYWMARDEFEGPKEFKTKRRQHELHRDVYISSGSSPRLDFVEKRTTPNPEKLPAWIDNIAGKLRPTRFTPSTKKFHIFKGKYYLQGGMFEGKPYIGLYEEMGETEEDNEIDVSSIEDLLDNENILLIPMWDSHLIRREGFMEKYEQKRRMVMQELKKQLAEKQIDRDEFVKRQWAIMQERGDIVRKNNKRQLEIDEAVNSIWRILRKEIE